MGLIFFGGGGMSGGDVLFRLNHTQSVSGNNQFKTHKSILRFLFCPQQTIIILVIMKITCTEQSSARTQCPASSTTQLSSLREPALTHPTAGFHL